MVESLIQTGPSESNINIIPEIQKIKCRLMIDFTKTLVLPPTITVRARFGLPTEAFLPCLITWRTEVKSNFLMDRGGKKGEAESRRSLRE